MRRAVFFGALVCLAASAGLAARQSETGTKTQPWAKILGSWKQLPGPDDPSALRVELEGGSMKLSFGCKQDGSCPDIIIVSYDGKLYKDIKPHVLTRSPWWREL